MDVQHFVIPSEVPWSELDKRYFGYIVNLPSPLNTLALQRQLFAGIGERTRLRSLAEVHPLVTCLPWLFAEAVPLVSDADLLNISEAGIFLLLALLLHDAFQDGQLLDYPDTPELHEHLQMAALQRFQNLFGEKSPFWSYLSEYVSQYKHALSREKEHWGQIRDYSFSRFYVIATGKVALFKAVTTAMALIGEQEAEISKLESALDYLAAALQLGDDIADWAEDYQSQQYTLPLTLAIPAQRWVVPDLSIEEISEILDNSAILEKLMTQMDGWFQQAGEAVDDLNCPHWTAFVKGCLTVLRMYQESHIARKLLKLIGKK